MGQIRLSFKGDMDEAGSILPVCGSLINRWLGDLDRPNHDKSDNKNIYILQLLCNKLTFENQKMLSFWSLFKYYFKIKMSTRRKL